jgi:hypothetical protein
MSAAGLLTVTSRCSDTYVGEATALLRGRLVCAFVVPARHAIASAQPSMALPIRFRT